MDEHRVGLQPTTQRTWSSVGVRPRQKVCPKYEWCFLWSFVRPSTGELEVWRTNVADTPMHSAILSKLAKDLGLGKQRRILLVVDKASWHTSKKLEVPEGIELMFTPTKTPELQPAEKLWPLVDEPLVGLGATELEQVHEVMDKRVLELQKQPNIIAAHTCFHWWPEPVSIKP